ncbi:type II toxin-antitoxin system VapB family antitoxin [[Mycobacterium] kokjensenii]|uniref:Type II toxin-antitoxin system VapB family antitoxin n=1 Tax=[Mycobacterium] kokjensenii TaxID=3064287 RepID=A0ABM9L7A2_9MYCO|nr:type II toxin-antitoxin system VapB family antitoxin [Mycolicibacter sp. MU0083]CAJ1493946.1 type II toxin-antitoxin system VapB family antitoxin [Mycolicibacter sp. MU0083]
MALNIEDPAVHDAVKEIARITGESHAQVVAAAVRERLVHLQADSAAVRFLDIGRRAAARMPEETKQLDHGALLYDDRGSRG